MTAETPLGLAWDETLTTDRRARVCMFVPLHATSPGGVDPAAIAVGALMGVAIWQVVRWVSTRGSAR